MFDLDELEIGLAVRPLDWRLRAYRNPFNNWGFVHVGPIRVFAGWP